MKKMLNFVKIYFWYTIWFLLFVFLTPIMFVVSGYEGTQKLWNLFGVQQ